MSAPLWTVITVVGAGGMAACYCLMHHKQTGVPALRALDKEFQCPDMRFRYTPEQLYAMFDGVGEAGARLMKRFWLVDFVFIAFFFLVMAAVTHNTAHLPYTRVGMYALSALRAIADGCENLLLLGVQRVYPRIRRDGLARAASCATGIKWALMGAWIVALFANLLVSATRM